MSIQNRIETAVKKGFLTLYEVEIPSVEFQATRKEFEGDITEFISFFMTNFIDEI